MASADQAETCGPHVALGVRLRAFPGIITLGVRPNYSDYTKDERELIRAAPVIYYPSLGYATELHAMGKRLFPSLNCHLYAGDKIRQTRLMRVLELPHPRTRVFFGKQRQHILEHFGFPFVAKTPRASALGLGVFLIKNQQDLDRYLARHNPAYIQEYIPTTRDIRVVLVGYRVVCAFWRRGLNGDFRHNLARGARLDFKAVPDEAVKLAIKAARLAGFDEVGIDLIWHQERPLLLEFNMKYGHNGPRQAGIDIPALIAGRILSDTLWEEQCPDTQ
jgi:ribosomal protein S6--L-glutamate ligase